MNNKIIFEGSKNRLRFHELNAILLLLDYFKSDVVCLSPGYNRTPDLLVDKIQWELKSPQGNSPDTIKDIQSVVSAIPNAALWRVPNLLIAFEFSLVGKTALAQVILSP